MSRNVLGTEILRDQAARNLAVEVKMLRTANTTNLGITACWRTHQKCCKSLPQRDLQGLEPSGIEQDFGFERHSSLKDIRVSLVAQVVKNASAMQETRIQSLGRKILWRLGNGYPLQSSCLENSMVRGAWWATVQGVTKSRT